MPTGVKGVVATSSMEDAEAPAVRVTVAGFKESPSPVGETLADRVTDPENPLMLVRVMVELPVEPTSMF